MRKSCRIKPILILFVLLGALVTLDGGEPVRVVIAEDADVPSGIQSPVLGDFVNLWVSDTVDNLEPAVAYNPRHDEYLVVWYNVQGPATWDVYAQRVKGDGTLGTWFTVAARCGLQSGAG
jgi:hypothetical protein